MKKCYYFPTWVDVSENVCISCDEKSIYVQPKNMFLGKEGYIISFWHDDLVSCDTRYEDDAISNDHLYIDKVHHAYTINGLKYEEDSLTPIASNTLKHAKRFTESTPSDPILAKLCELTGAKMYGDYVVLERIIHYHVSEDDNVLVGDLLWFDYLTGDIKDNYVIASKNQKCCEFYSHRIYNIFQEYSKFLRNEKSKWEEVKKIVL